MHPFWLYGVLIPATATTLAAQGPHEPRSLERTVRYEHRLFNPNEEPATGVTIWVPAPHDCERQDVHWVVPSRRGFAREFIDVHGQRLFEYEFEEIPPHAFVEVGFTATVTLRDRTWPRSGIDAELTPEERARYLAPASNYSLESKLMRETAAELTAGAQTDLEKAERIFDWVVENVRYERDGRWDAAEVVLRRGTGSCSEFNYLLSGLCRLSDLPTRCVGGTSSRDAPLPYTDTVFHRWTEVFVDGCGWLPLDCSRGSNPRRDPRDHFGKVFADLLVWCRQAGGDEDYLRWEYRARSARAGGGPLRATNRARWFEAMSRGDFDAAVAWLERGRGGTPGGDALECALVAWERARDSAAVVRRLAAAGRYEAVRRAAFGRDVDLLDEIATPALAAAIRERAGEPWTLRKWLRDQEQQIASADGRFALTGVEVERAGPATTEASTGR